MKIIRLPPETVLDVEIKDLDSVWYGPHPCPECGNTIVQRGTEYGPLLRLEAPHGHHYPNHVWEKHECQKKMPIQTLRAGTVLKFHGIPIALPADLEVYCGTDLSKIEFGESALEAQRSEGGKARAKKLSKEQRVKIAKSAANSRWRGKK